ncbi:MAG: GNAT family N-acetyltransferase [Solobacterium sp.]|nr:GNAT family N-acetyltransferase [Solobacterium sp.]
MFIRRFEPEDASAVSGLIAETMRISNARDYPSNVLEDLIAHRQPQDILLQAAETHFYVAEEKGEIIACGAIGRKHSCCCLYSIFVHPSYQGKGIGAAIVATLEQDAYAAQTGCIEVPASITALPFCRKLGYGFRDSRELDENDLYRLVKYHNGTGGFRAFQMQHTCCR